MLKEDSTYICAAHRVPRQVHVQKDWENRNRKLKRYSTEQYCINSLCSFILSQTLHVRTGDRECREDPLDAPRRVVNHQQDSALELQTPRPNRVEDPLRTHRALLGDLTGAFGGLSPVAPVAIGEVIALAEICFDSVGCCEEPLHR
jgi:hypothetical protein